MIDVFFCLANKDRCALTFIIKITNGHIFPEYIHFNINKLPTKEAKT